MATTTKTERPRVGRSLLAALAIAGCGSTPPAKPAAPKPPPPPLHHGPVTDYVPAAGLRWMVVGSPRRIAADTRLRDALVVLLPDERLDKFARGTGVDIRRIESAAAAGFDLGTLYAWAPPASSMPAVTARFRERIVSGEHRAQPHPAIERTSGIIGATPEALLQVGDEFAAVAVGDLTLIRVAEAFARERLHSSPAALKGAALTTLEPVPSSSVATFYAPGPFTGEWARGARGLLANALAMSVSLTPADAGKARIELQLAGDFTVSGGAELKLAFDDLTTSPIGKLLALDQSADAPVISEKDQRLYLDVDVDLAPIARGLHAAVAADIWEIMDMKRPD